MVGASTKMRVAPLVGALLAAASRAGAVCPSGYGPGSHEIHLSMPVDATSSDGGVVWQRSSRPAEGTTPLVPLRLALPMLLEHSVSESRSVHTILDD